MILIAILIGTVAAGVGSVWLAAFLGFSMLARYTQHMLSLAAGALMATAFMHLLPEAFESQASAQELFATLLAGLCSFSCSTRPNSGTTATSTTMSTTTTSVRVPGTAPRRAMRSTTTTTTTTTLLPVRRRTPAASITTTSRARVAGRCSRATACTRWATAS